MYKILWWHPKTTVMYLVHLFSFKPTWVHFLTYLGMPPPCSWLGGANRRGHKAEVGAANGKSMGTLKRDPLSPGKDGIPGLREALSCARCWAGGWTGNQASGPGVYINLLSCLGSGWGADPVGWSCPINWRRMRTLASQGGSEDLK